VGGAKRHLTRPIASDDTLALQPRHDVLIEEARPMAESRDGVVAHFVQSTGPFTEYERTIRSDDGRLVETTSYRLNIPWFAWLFGPLLRRTLRRSATPGSAPFWAPPDVLSARQVSILGLLAAASLLSAFTNTLFTQTVAFAGDDLGVGDWGRGVGGTVVRLGIIVGLPFALAADRIGRRRVIVGLAWAAPIIASLGALAPNFPVLVATQSISRPLGLALDLLVAVVAAEEMPRSSRAYSVSILAMASGLGAGLAVVSLPLADIGDGGWRLVYVLALVWLFVAVDLTRRLPETQRFERHVAEQKHVDAPMQSRRLGIQMAVAFFGNLLLAPSSFFQNGYLKDERGFSAGMVAVFTLITTTPGVLGLVLGGRAADKRGRRRIATICVPIGAALIVGSFWFGGPLMWSFAVSGSIVAAMAYPSLAVYRTELFPTGRRGRAAYLILASALVGGSLSLLVTGALLDNDVSHGAILSALWTGPMIVALIVWFTYPETAHRELEEINPEDLDPNPRG